MLVYQIKFFQKINSCDVIAMQDPQAKCAVVHFSYYLLGKGCYLFGSVGLFICLSVCGHYSKSYERIGMKFYGGVLGSTMKS